MLPLRMLKNASLHGNDFEKGMEAETELFWELLLHSEQGRAYRHVFFAQRQVTKPITTVATNNVHRLLLSSNALASESLEQGPWEVALRRTFYWLDIQK